MCAYSLALISRKIFGPGERVRVGRQRQLTGASFRDRENASPLGEVAVLPLVSRAILRQIVQTLRDRLVVRGAEERRRALIDLHARHDVPSTQELDEVHVVRRSLINRLVMQNHAAYVSRQLRLRAEKPREIAIRIDYPPTSIKISRPSTRITIGVEMSMSV